MGYIFYSFLLFGLALKRLDVVFMANSLLGIEPTKMPKSVKKKPEKPPMSPNSAMVDLTTR